MALNGIDAQIIAQRAMDVAKDASTINKKNELMQDYMAQHRKAEDELQDTMVSKLQRKDDPQITKEHGGSGRYTPDERKRNKKETQPENGGEEEDEEPGIVSSSHVDIKI